MIRPDHELAGMTQAVPARTGTACEAGRYFFFAVAGGAAMTSVAVMVLPSVL